MFWKLPPEVRDIIYGLVYGEPKEVKVKSRYSWKASEKKRRTHEQDKFVVNLRLAILAHDWWLTITGYELPGISSRPNACLQAILCGSRDCLHESEDAGL